MTNANQSNEEYYNILKNTYGQDILTIIKKCRSDYEEIVPNAKPRASRIALTAHMIAAYFAREKYEYEIPGFTGQLFSSAYHILRSQNTDGSHVSGILGAIMALEGRDMTV